MWAELPGCLLTIEAVSQAQSTDSWELGRILAESSVSFLRAPSSSPSAAYNIPSTLTSDLTYYLPCLRVVWKETLVR
ncbi:hypothetical protein BDV24DRAFT_139220 [Aspergillus arachidicola]|uniref:Uncharacterized protein n=1 Tax=Aspergillus arachidicola TaxID=656916 RepID=A0A5N6Y1Z6_9EURO|nr:hypothetical protein BDV24DRAFT_139220 [Aspergillus arachidicola]